MGLAVVGFVPVGQAQVLITGDSTSYIPYTLYISEGPLETTLDLFDSAKPATPGALAMESFPASPGTPAQQVTVTLSFSDSVAAGAVCGASCFEEGLNVAGTLNISGDNEPDRRELQQCFGQRHLCGGPEAGGDTARLHLGWNQ